MDLPTYTNIWRIEKRLYKLYDLRLPMPLPLVQIGVFLGVFVPWIVMLRFAGIPFESPWHVLYIVPPGVLTWLATRPVIEGKRLTELLLSQGRYLAEPRTWCRLTPIQEPREVVIVARVWRRAEAPAPVAAAERAAIKSRRRRKAAAARPAPSTQAVAPTPVLLPRPAAAAVPPSLGDYAAQRDAHVPAPEAPAPAAHVPAAPQKPWRRTSRDISHEDDVLPGPTELERPPATPQLEVPPSAPGSGKRAFASGVRRPGAPAEFWQATVPRPTRPDIPQHPRVNVRKAAEEIANATHPTPAEQKTPVDRPDTQFAGHPPEVPADGSHAESDVQAAGRAPEERRPPEQPPAEGSSKPIAGRDSAGAAQARAAARPEVPADGSGAESDVRVAGQEPEERRPAEWQPASSDGSSKPVAGREPAGAEQAHAAAPPEVPADGSGGESDVRVAGRGPEEGRPAERHPAPAEGSSQPVAGRDSAGAEQARVGEAREEGVAGEGVPLRGGGVPAPRRVPQRSNGEPGDKKVAGWKTSAPQRAPGGGAGRAVPPPAPDERGIRETRPDVPRPWAPQQQREAGRPPATRPDIPMVPGAFGSRPESQHEETGQQQPAEPPRMEPPRPWSEGLSKPRPNRTWPPVQEPAAQAPPEPPPPAPVEEQAPPRDVRSQPASPVRPRPLPPPPAPPPSGPAITPPDPEHEVSTGGLRRLFHAVGGGHGDVDADYQQRLQQPFHGSRHVVVLGCTGGAGQTVTGLMLGHTFAQHNGEPVVAIDVNPGPGALARRTRSDTNETLTGLITRADQVGSLTAMRRYTSQAKSGLDVIAAGKNPLQALDDRDYALAIRTIDRFYSVTLLDAAAAVVARVLPYADQVVLVAPASADAPRAVAMTFEWLDGHGYEELRSRAVTVINGVSRRSMDDVEQAEAVARGRCRALVRIPWDDHLSMDRAPRNELKSLRTPTRRAYLALAGVVAGGFTVMPERYQELQQEQEATR